MKDRPEPPADGASARTSSSSSWRSTSSFPIWWLVVAATKNTSGLFGSSAFWFDDHFALFENIAGLFTHQGGIYWRWLGNSFVYAFAGGIGATVLAILAGYGFAKYRFRGRGAVFTIILGSVMVPLTALVIPTFMLLSQYGIINTPWAVILPSLLSPFGVYLMRVYTQDAVPDEMLEAARIDGAGELRTFFQVALPLLRPGDRDGAAAVGRRHLEQLLPPARRAHRPRAAAGHRRPQPLDGALQRRRRRRAGLEPHHDRARSSRSCRSSSRSCSSSGTGRAGSRSAASSRPRPQKPADAPERSIPQIHRTPDRKQPCPPHV